MSARVVREKRVEERGEERRRNSWVGGWRGGEVWDEEMEGRPIRGREDLSADDGCADSKG